MREENENARTKRVVFSLNDARPRKNVSRARDCGDVVALFFFFAKEVEICIYILCDVGWG
jgi:hypothetical protein